ncbi:histidine phosphatase family protein [Halosimplex aquaticum]|uniref:Histidine phosphatase family protein n=1 Tax=Halosimplex aquaticum TaxID=3026162 RepID=A0ABD5XWV5_9EURY|nr:histidine phosphatase family protein [Halosimplex aquaticum]
MGTVVFVRHGETAWNAENRAQGWAPTSLTERGHRQAEELADHLDEAYDFDRIVSSDIRRAKETARIVNERFDGDIEYDSAWREQDLGTLQGFRADALERQFPEYAVAEAGRTASKRTPESGECFEDMCDRIAGAWETIRESVDEETYLVVAHGGSIRIVLGEVMGMSIEEGVEHLTQDNCAVNVASVEDDEVAIDVENDTDYRRE